MSNPAPKKAKIKKPRKKNITPNKSISLSSMLGGGVALIGLLVSVLTLFPRLTVTNNGTNIDPQDPFSTPFHITNEGYLPLFRAEFWIYINHTRSIAGGGLSNGRFTGTTWTAPVFGPTDAFDLYAGTIVRNLPDFHLASADVDIVVRYYPIGFLFKRERSFHFVTQLGPDDNLHWLQKPD